MPLVAVSPQVPERLVEIKTRHHLQLQVTSDPDNNLGRRLGILYSFDEASRKAALAKGNFIGDTTGTGTWELPQPPSSSSPRTARWPSLKSAGLAGAYRSRTGIACG